MASIVGLDDLSQSLIDAGDSLVKLHSSTDELLTLLDETESLLKRVEQDQPLSMQKALIPLKNALVSVDLLNHLDSNVRVSIVSCLTEIVRIAAPEAPYNDDQMKEIFKLTNEAFEKLADVSSSRSYKKAESVLDNVSKVKSCLMMLDLECDDLILHMFRSFLRIIRSDHPRVVFTSMEMIMITIIDETEQVSADLLNILLATVKKDNQNVSSISRSLVEKVLSRCAFKLKPYIVEALKSSGTTLDMYSPVVLTVCLSVSEPTKVNNKAAETKLGRQVASIDSLEEQLGLEHSREKICSKSSSKRPVRDGTQRINVRNGNTSNLRSESRDGETDIGVTGKRGRKPNSLMNPDEGYDISWILGKRDHSSKTSSDRKRRKIGESSSHGKVTTASATSRALTGSVKRSRIKMDDDLDSLSSPRLKKLASCFRDEDSLEKKSNQNDIERRQRTAKKKPLVKPRGKRSSARSETSKKRRQTTRKEVKGFGEDLVGKRVNVWWPLDKIFYEGVIESYCGRKKMHRVVYSDGDSEELNLIEERWELLDDLTSASEEEEEEEEEEIDLPESIPLFDIMQKVKKSKNMESTMKKLNKQIESGSNDETRQGKNRKSLKELNAEADRTEEQEEVSQDVDDCSESEKQEESDNNGEDSLKLTDDTEAETKEEESEREESESESDSEEEPKWRETEDVEDEVEEEVDGKETNLSEIKKEEDEERE